MSRGDYDIRAGLPRILNLFEKHDLPATFMVPAQVVDEHPDACADIAAQGRNGAIAAAGGHDIGYHGYFHESVLDVT